MYYDQLRHEQLSVHQGWMHIAADVSRFFRQLGRMLTLRRSQTLTTFTVHRVPGTDVLR